MPSPNEAVARAVSLIGDKSHKALADELGVTPGAVSHWVTGKRRVSTKHVRDIERATNGRVTRHDLRPDVFGAANDGEGR